MSFADKTLQCRECGAEFVFTMGEQQFYADRGLVNEPGRCPHCRAARRQRMATGETGNSGTAPGGGGRATTREMHPVICAACGASTQVPFLPRNERPVYCSSCFDRVRGRA